jgi:hypothetical protein
MKMWPLLIGIILLCALVSSPVLAIGKSDLIAYYRTTPVSPAHPGTTPGPAENSKSYNTTLPIDTATFPKWTLPDIITKKPNSNYFCGPFIFSDTTAISWKPNIYLYSDHDLTARVRLAPELAITVSDPVYQPGMGWLAEIRDGSLNGNGDFLFYESVVPASVWQKKEGYVIRAESREQDMAFMLGRYGFNEKETVEFIDYWSSHLTGGIDYAFYPQETGAVDRVMPLSVSPIPDYVSRIWFYAEPLVSAPEPVTDPEQIVREGLYVVEWGVIMR